MLLKYPIYFKEEECVVISLSFAPVSINVRTIFKSIPQETTLVVLPTVTISTCFTACEWKPF